MPQEAMIQLAEALKNDQAFREKFLSAKSLEERSKVAAGRGIGVTAEDLVALFGPDAAQSQGEISEADLAEIAGGRVASLRTILCTLDTCFFTCGGPSLKKL
jgi:predicted ribosomally synthesized peptide with nif11-like leader